MSLRYTHTEECGNGNISHQWMNWGYVVFMIILLAKIRVINIIRLYIQSLTLKSITNFMIKLTWCGKRKNYKFDTCRKVFLLNFYTTEQIQHTQDTIFVLYFRNKCFDQIGTLFITEITVFLSQNCANVIFIWRTKLSSFQRLKLHETS